jgi:hypothetical protein
VRSDTIKRFILPPGPLLSLTLIGITLLSGVIYYRAVTSQRFLEPALAISQPRIEFAEGINALLAHEFGAEGMQGIKFRTGSVLIDRSVFFGSAESEEVRAKLGRFFYAALSDERIREHISLILVGPRFPLGPDAARNREVRAALMSYAGALLNSLYEAEPRLEPQFGGFFASAAMPVDPAADAVGWIEFRIIPTERLHIEVIQRLGKYVQ